MNLQRDYYAQQAQHSKRSKVPTLNVVLTNHQINFIEQLVRSGRYQNTNEVLRESLRLHEQREAEDASRLVALRSAVKVGIADFDQGQFLTYDTSKALGAHLNSVASKAIAAT